MVGVDDGGGYACIGEAVYMWGWGARGTGMGSLCTFLSILL